MISISDLVKGAKKFGKDNFVADITQEEEYINLKGKFDEYYKSTLEPVLVENEKVRKKYFKMFISLLLISLVACPLVISLSIENIANLVSNTGAPQNSKNDASLIVIAIFIAIVSGPILMYKKAVKETIMGKFANFFGTFEYQYGKYIDDYALQSSGLFKNFDIHSGDDYFSGIYNDVGITISEEELSKRKEKVNRKPSAFAPLNNGAPTFIDHASGIHVFKGICIRLEMNKNFSGHTIAVPDGGIFNFFSSKNGKSNVKLEDSVFEKIFEVYSSDQVEARYLLTTAFMYRMIKLRELFNCKKGMAFSFRDNHLLIVIPTTQNLFEANSFFSNTVNKERIDLVFQQFYTVFSIVNILKLNMRIGM